MIDFNNFFDLNIIINEVIGSVMLTVLIGLFIIWFLGAKNRATGGLLLMASAMFLIIFINEFSLTLMWMLVLLVIGLSFYSVIKWWVNR